MTRREWLAASGWSLLATRDLGADESRPPAPKMGLVIHSFWIRQATDRQHSLDDPLAFLDYCLRLGAGGVQTSLGKRGEDYAAKVRKFLETHKLYLEGSISLPKDKADVERFAAEVHTAKQCGASVFRTVLLSGRRYEVFETADAFRASHERAKQSLALARPVVEKHEISMAVENHKDLRSVELLELIEKHDSPLVGVCLDTGNSIALLEPPQETADLLAPHTFTTHIKDMGVEEYAEGFLLAEVPLGTGFVDIPGLISDVRKHRPNIQLNLEMMTRDPLKIPCLTPKYWATLDNVKGRRLADMIALVRSKAAKKALPRISNLNKEEQLQCEEDNVKQCLRYASDHLKG
jgi:sugar phosphate isomerase/epimerase